ncbi:MAG TPA: proton-conducting transporter membrane subunit [Tenuifilaceae bacterium]|nr:proton-conducting transporter membrane subunit [Tenuifilaceae bacterium]
MIYIVIIGIFLAAVTPWIYKLVPKYIGFWLSIFPLGVFVWSTLYFDAVLTGIPIIETYSWVNVLAFNLQFRLDGLSLFFIMLISGFGTFIFMYANSYLAGDENKGKFFVYLILFTTAMLGLVLSGNLLMLFVFWELTSLTSYLLIGYYHNDEGSRKSALMAMLVTVSGGLFMLAGIVLIGIEAGTLDIGTLLSNPKLITGSERINIIVVLLIIGAITKSAQFPFHFWLPNAMAAPAPVSAFLHSTTMVKAGIFLLARMSSIFSETEIWSLLLIHIGGFTMVYGGLMAVMNTDMKKVLAYTTISALGIMVLLLGIGTTVSVQAAMVFLLAHALYKGTLFMVTGNVDHETGTRDLDSLSGLGKKMPFTFYSAALASLSMAGVIPFFGFIAKEILYGAAFDSTAASIVVGIATFFTGVLFTSIAIEFGYKIFTGKPSVTPKPAHEVPVGMKIGPVVFASLGLVGGVFSEQLAQPLLHHTSNVVLNVDKVLELSLWHGFTLVFGLSLLTLLFGTIVYRNRTRIRIFTKYFSLSEIPGPEKLYKQSIPGLLSFAKMQTKFFQSGKLRNYLVVIISAFVSLIIIVIWKFDWKIAIPFVSRVGFKWYEMVFIVLMLVAMVKTLITSSRLVAIISLGVIGYGVAIIFLFYGGPDVAMTQFLIETLTVVIFVLILNRLPKFTPISKNLQLRLVIPSILFGVVMTVILLMVISNPLNSPLKEFFGANSYILAKGRNVVNVILVDFRGVDTLGEITVLAIGALGIYSLLKIKPKSVKKP